MFVELYRCVITDYVIFRSHTYIVSSMYVFIACWHDHTTVVSDYAGGRQLNTFIIIVVNFSVFLFYVCLLRTYTKRHSTIFSKWMCNTCLKKTNKRPRGTKNVTKNKTEYIFCFQIPIRIQWKMHNGKMCRYLLDMTKWKVSSCQFNRNCFFSSCRQFSVIIWQYSLNNYEIEQVFIRTLTNGIFFLFSMK